MQVIKTNKFFIYFKWFASVFTIISRLRSMYKFWTLSGTKRFLDKNALNNGKDAMEKSWAASQYFVMHYVMTFLSTGFRCILIINISFHYNSIQSYIFEINDKYKIMSNILVEIIFLVLSKDDTHLILNGYLHLQKYCNEIIRVSNAICNNKDVQIMVK